MGPFDSDGQMACARRHVARRLMMCRGLPPTPEVIGQCINPNGGTPAGEIIEALAALIDPDEWRAANGAGGPGADESGNRMWHVYDGGR